MVAAQFEDKLHGAEPYRILAVKHRILVVIFRTLFVTQMDSICERTFPKKKEAGKKAEKAYVKSL